MKIIKFRKRIDRAILGGATILAIMPAIGLITGTAFSMGLYGVNYQEASLQDNPEQYWFVIRLELAIVLFFMFRSIIAFPVLGAAYQQVLIFRERNKVLAYAVLYLIIPILAVALCLTLLSVFNL